MKRATFAISAIGIAVIVAAVWAADPSAVAAAVMRAGAASFWVVAVRALAVTLAGSTWWLLFPPSNRPRMRICMLLRFVREGANTLLPLTQVGGDFIAARLLTFWGTPGTLGVATVVVDVLIQAVTQLLFALAGLAILAAVGTDSAPIRGAAWGLALAVPALTGFYLVQRHWGEALLTGLLRRLARGREWAVHGKLSAVFQSLHSVYGRGGALVATFVAHLAIWFLGAVEVWIALSAMGYDVSYREAIAIESLAQAARGAAFVVPGAVGVQEGGLVVLCGLFGVPAQSALALSLIKRAADIAVGVPGLIAWHRLEVGRWIKRSSTSSTPT